MNNKKKDYKWNLKLLYESPEDPRIERDIVVFEKLYNDFAEKYDTVDKDYLKDDSKLLEVLESFEILVKANENLKVESYFYSLKDIEASNNTVSAKIALLNDRLTKSVNKILFFQISLGDIDAERQRLFLDSNKLSKYKVFLQRVFEDAKYELSVPEEKIMGLKSMTSRDMWIMGNEKILNVESVDWKGKRTPIAKALSIVHELESAKDRRLLTRHISEALKRVAPFSEAEMNAIVTDKKINDELRGHKTPFGSTIQRYRNNPLVVETLINVVTENFRLAQRFYQIKARLLGQKKLYYCDRGAKIGKIKTKFTFEKSFALLKTIFGDLNPIFRDKIDEYMRNGQIDVYPRIGKRGGAYCNGQYTEPTLILLNHNDDIRSFSTFAHEIGHAFHALLSRRQDPFYFNYSTSLAETASTLFESIAMGSVYKNLNKKEQIIALHDKIGDELSTIFRQVACFNYEKEIHETIRAKGYQSKEELALMHNKHMKTYLGPVFDLKPDDGYMFVQWSHIRRFFYVYTYAYGLLVSKALLSKYREDKSFWKKIEQFLSSGGNDSPENILKKIGIDVSKPEFWLGGIREIENDINLLEKLTKE